MPRLTRFAFWRLCRAVVVGAGACGRSDLFGARHNSGPGGDISSRSAAAAVAAVGGPRRQRRGGVGGSVGGTRRHRRQRAGRGGGGGSAAGRGGTGGSGAGAAGRRRHRRRHGGTRRHGRRHGRARRHRRRRGGARRRRRRLPVRARSARSATTASTTTATTSPTARTRAASAIRAARRPARRSATTTSTTTTTAASTAPIPTAWTASSCRPTHGHGDLRQRRRRQQQQPRRLRRPAVHDLPGLPGGRRARPTSTSAPSRRTAPRVARRWTRRGATAGYATCAPAGGVGRVGPVPARRDGGRPRRLQARPGQRARRRPVPRRREPGLRSQPGRRASTSGDNPTATQHVLGAGARRLLGDRRVVPEPAAARRRSRCRPDRSRRRRSAPTARTTICNGLTDCQDAACKNARVLRRQRVHPRRQRSGTLVVDGPTRSRRPRTCAARPTTTSRPARRGVAGGDVAIAFTLAEAAGLAGPVPAVGPQHLRALPDAGARARLRRRSAVLRVRGRGARTRSRSSGLPAGRYVFIVKAQSVAQAGTINLRLLGLQRPPRRDLRQRDRRRRQRADRLRRSRLLRRRGLPGARLHAGPGSRHLLVGHAAHGHRRHARRRHALPDLVQPRHRQGARAAREPDAADEPRPRLHRQRLARARAVAPAAAARRLRRERDRLRRSRGAAVRLRLLDPRAAARARTTSSSRRSRRAARAPSR